MAGFTGWLEHNGLSRSLLLLFCTACVCVCLCVSVCVCACVCVSVFGAVSHSISVAPQISSNQQQLHAIM